jgi:hypothetical protein
VPLDLSPVANAGEYRDRNNRESSLDDGQLESLLTAVTRAVEKRLGLAPGMLLPQDDLTFSFTAYVPNPYRVPRLLALRDTSSQQYLLRVVSADGIGIDSQYDGTYDGYELDFDNGWVRGYPENAAALGQPYTHIQLLTGISGATYTAWTDRVMVQVTGDWGWAACPEPIKERVIGMTRELVEVHRAGPTLTVYNVDENIQMNPSTRTLMSALEKDYSHRLVGVA